MNTATAFIDDMLPDKASAIFQNARIIGSQVDYATYSKQTVQRGHRDYVMSRGELVEFLNCPSRWRKGYMDDDDQDTKATEWGHLIDALVLDADDSRIAITPETYPDSKTGDPKPWNWNATFCKSWRDEHAGEIITKPENYSAATRAVESLYGDQEIFSLIKSAQKQVMVTADYADKETGLVVPVRALIDLVPSGDFSDSLSDLKTCRTAHPKAFESSAFNCAYHVQAALYLDIFNAAANERRSSWWHILLESQRPYECDLRYLSSEFVRLGRESYTEALKLYCKCLTDGFWPGYRSHQTYKGRIITEPKPYMIMEAA